MVEHEEEFFRHADWLIDIGPGAGSDGGEVIFNMLPFLRLHFLPDW